MCDESIHAASLVRAQTSVRTEEQEHHAVQVVKKYSQTDMSEQKMSSGGKVRFHSIYMYLSLSRALTTTTISRKKKTLVFYLLSVSLNSKICFYKMNVRTNILRSLFLSLSLSLPNSKTIFISNDRTPFSNTDSPDSPWRNYVLTRRMWVYHVT